MAPLVAIPIYLRAFLRFFLAYASKTTWLLVRSCKSTSSGIGVPDRVPAPGFDPWPLQNLHMGCSIRDRRPLHGEPHGDALAASLLTLVSSLDHFGGARILG
ncbi:unnamed protein product [Brassica rapa subsp. narinosa]